MAPKATKSDEPKSGIVAVHKLDENGKPDGNPHYAAADAKWVREGIEAGTVKLVEEVPADATQVPASGDAAASGNRVNS